MSKHSAGKWERSGLAVYATDGDVEGGVTVREIVWGAHNTRGGSPEEREANARLIAAAPDLLAALRAARGYVSQPKVLAAILSAIAKATGGEP